MSRWKAAAIHLLISIFIAVIAASLLLLIWYPPPYFHAAGADELVLLLAGADVALGPLLTLIVFRTGKKHLRLDLAAIATLQSVALAYGLLVVLESRPVFLVAAIDRFSVVSASDIDPADLAKGSSPEFRTLSWTGPVIVAAELPDSAQERSDLIFSGLRGKDIDRLPKYYVDYARAVKGLLARAKRLEEIPNLDVDARIRLETAVKKAGQPKDSIVWLPVSARKADVLMLLDKSDGRPLGAVAIAPWPN